MHHADLVQLRPPVIGRTASMASYDTADLTLHFDACRPISNQGRLSLYLPLAPNAT